MKTWAWIWLGALALLGWAPALMVAYFVALALAMGTEAPGPLWFGMVYVGLLATCLLMLAQVRRYFALEGREAARFTWIGGAVLVTLWGGACLAFTLLTGGL